MSKKPKAVLISCFDWYEKRLKYIGNFLEENGYRVDYMSSNFDHLLKCHIDKYKDVKNFHYINVPKYTHNISVSRLISHKVFSTRVVKAIEQIRPELVYCLIPPNSLAKDIAKLKKEHKFFLIYDVIDLWPESFPKAKSVKFVFKPWQDMRDKYIDYADRVILECNYYRQTFKKIIPETKSEIIPIVKPCIGNVEEKGAEQDICLAYLGSINSLIDIERISSIVSDISKEKSVLVRIIGDGSNKDKFIDELKMAGAKVEYYGKIFDDLEKKKILGACDFGLNIYKESVSIGLTLKSVDYFQLGLPILNSIPGDTEKLVNKYDIGINSSELSSENIVKTCKHISDLKKNVSKMFVNEFSPEIIGKKMSALKFWGNS